MIEVGCSRCEAHMSFLSDRAAGEWLAAHTMREHSAEPSAMEVAMFYGLNGPKRYEDMREEHLEAPGDRLASPYERGKKAF